MNILNKLQNHSPAILSGAGILGFFTAVVMTAKVAPRAQRTIDSEPTKTERIKTVVKFYAPTAGMLMLSTGCIMASNRIHRQRYASLLALYSVGEYTLQKWQNSVVEEVTKKKFESIKEKVIRPEEDPPDAFLVDDDRVLLYDNYTGRYFKANSVESVRKVINDMNDDMYIEDFVPLNDFYYGVGLPPVQFGNNVGWNMSDGSIKVDFDALLKEDRPVVTVNFRLMPRRY